MPPGQQNVARTAPWAPSSLPSVTSRVLLDRWHGEREVVEFSQGRAIITATYRSFVNDAKSAAAALLRMGVRRGTIEAHMSA